MNILIIGGTKFVGRALTDVALERGHEVTLFHRGQTGEELFPNVQRIHGDRNHDLDRLKGQWDVVVDTCAYRPREVEAVSERLRNHAKAFAFVSTISVYDDMSVPGIDEGAPLASYDGPETDEVNGTTYGPFKVQCEEVVHDRWGGDALIVRPGLIVGPHDPTDRFTYWPWRVAQGGKMVAPGEPGRGIQYVDAHDLARFAIEGLERNLRGTFNVVGPESPVPFEPFLETCRKVTSSTAEFVWIDDSKLEAHEVGAMVEMPFWLPASSPKQAGLFAIDASRARSEGLSHRPMAEIIRDTVEWAMSRPVDHTWRAGLAIEKERALLAE
ncbi:MAG: NAD-dependent epimerase/dehydratase family protein [Planctomycetota bacterium]